MLRPVNVGRKSLADYSSIVPRDLMAEIDELAERLEGRVAHVNATAFGGGVAEILYTLVPLVSDIGLEADWQILTAPEFFNVTKSFHNGLQGHPVSFPPEAALFEGLPRQRRRAHAALRLRRHPRPAAARHPRLRRRQDRSTWIWRCHIDTSTPDQGVLDYLLPSINRYDLPSTPWPTTCRRATACRCASSRRPSTRWRPRT